MQLDLLSKLNKLRSERVAAIVTTNLKTGAQLLFENGKIDSAEPLKDELEVRFLSGKSGMVGEFFLATYLPPPRLVLIGAVHIAQHMIGPAQAAGFDVTVIDPRSAFANESRFPGVSLYSDWSDEVLKTRPLDAYTALAALSHDPKIDDDPIIQALETGCFYIGALGSRKTHVKRLDRLRAAGIREELLSTIDAPIGLDIGAANPAEIAIAVLGQIISTLRGKT